MIAGMTAAPPTNFEIEIDRDELIRRTARELRGIAGACIAFPMALACFIWFSALTEKPASVVQVVGVLLATAFVTLLGMWVGRWLYHCVHGHRYARKTGTAFRATVEGAYLRMQRLNDDRKVHFRQIVDYTVKGKGSKRVPGVASIVMSTTSGAQNAGLQIPCVKNALEVRDLLAEVDAQREL